MQFRNELQRSLVWAVFEQDTELVPSQPGKRIPFSHLTLQPLSQLPEQLVTRNVTTGVVDDLETVQIQVAERVLTRRLLETRQQCLQALLECPSVEQIGQRIMARLVTELLGQAERVADVTARPSVTLKHAVKAEDGFSGCADDAPGSVRAAPETLHAERLTLISDRCMIL